MTENSRLIDIARQLARLRRVPTASLAEIVQANGKCWWETYEGDPPWAAECLTDRALAALLCAGCPVQAECLELELRTHGTHTVGVWGALPEDDRRALLQHWTWTDDRPEEGGTAR